MHHGVIVLPDMASSSGMREPSDEDLMARVASGDAGAFRVLSARHAPRAVALARRYLSSDADAEDVAQEALLRVWRAAPSWQPTARFTTWFYRIVVNLCLNQKRRAEPAPLDDVPEPVDPTPDAEARWEEAQERDRIADAVSHLPDRQRAALLLTYWEGLSNSAVADALGTTVGSVETLLVRARKALRDRLQPREGGK
ncbi:MULTISPECIES: sigma-70 family RNA polymerase sigma factor [Azorhizobium]|nr:MULTISPECIES: sigma-70 family RNA polymerase sigma factor [Azorhizobium]